MLGFGMMAGVGLLSFGDLALEWNSEEASGLVQMERRDVERV